MYRRAAVSQPLLAMLEPRSYSALHSPLQARGLSGPVGDERLRALLRGATLCSDAANAVLLFEARTPKLARLEAALFVADSPLSPRKLAQFAALAGVKEVRDLIDELNDSYDHTDSPYRIERVATGFQMLTLPRYAPWLDRLHHRQTQLKLSPPMLETLSIVAYRQPATRADIEAVRGVQSAELLKQLMEKGLVKIVGEDDSLGRPYLYGTTRAFLERFGLTTLDDLPQAETLRRPASTAAAKGETDDALDVDESASATSGPVRVDAAA
jgi:segregation and condensation protein B